MRLHRAFRCVLGLALACCLVGCASDPNSSGETKRPKLSDGWEKEYYPSEFKEILKALDKDESDHFLSAPGHSWYHRGDEYVLYIPPMDAMGCFEEVILIRKTESGWHLISDHNELCVE